VAGLSRGTAGVTPRLPARPLEALIKGQRVAWRCYATAQRTYLDADRFRRVPRHATLTSRERSQCRAAMPHCRCQDDHTSAEATGPSSGGGDTKKRRVPRDLEGSSASVLIDRYHEQDATALGSCGHFLPKLSNSPFRAPPRKACHSSDVNRRTAPSGSLLLRTPIPPSGRLATSTQLPLEKLRELLTQ
jgi:hypothetical protein